MTGPNRFSDALADRYAIERELGAGGMAKVYLAQDVKHRRHVAIKVLRPELAAALGAERFLREIEIAAGLHHPHILALFDSGEAAGFLYYVMPFVEGESLRDRLSREKQLPLDDALLITREVADALSHAHSRGLVHRDIKPENILLENGHAIVADFGIARAISAAGEETLTQTGLAIGTPQYMSPEQAAGERTLDGRTDLYALGCVLYEMLAGEPPYTGPTPQAIMARRLTEPVRPVRAVRDSVPVVVETAIHRALAKVPADRFATALQFSEALARPDEAAPRNGPRPPAARIAAVALVTLALGGFAWRFLRHRPFTIGTSNAVQVTSAPGIEFQAALSPDGKQVAFQADGRITISRAAAVGGAGELRPGQEVGGSQEFPVWTPDGASLRFWSCAGSACAWREVGQLGGPARLVDLPRQTPRVAWSRDDTRAALVAQDSIYVYSKRDRVTSLLTVHPKSQGLHSLAWSPDGRWIAYVNGNPFWPGKYNLSRSSIWLVASDGKRVAVTNGADLNVSPAWLDPHHVLFVSDRDGQREVYVVEVDAAGPHGEPHKVPGATDAHSISVSADGTRLAFTKYQARSNVWVYPIGSRPVSIRDGRPVTTGAQAVETNDVSRDGQWLAYSSNLGASAGGSAQIFKMRVDGGAPIPVVPSGEGPRWSPDGREIAFDDFGIRVVSADGGAAVRLTHPADSEYDAPALWSPDGLHLAFWRGRGGRLDTWVLNRERLGAPWSEPVQLTTFGCAASAWAPDGRGVLCRSQPDEQALVLVSLTGAVLWRRDMSGAGFSGMPVYSPDGSMWFMAKQEGDRNGFWAWPVAGGEPRLVVVFDDPALEAATSSGAYSVTRDRLYVTVAESESDIWVMDLKR